VCWDQNLGVGRDLKKKKTKKWDFSHKKNCEGEYFDI
jgi:hypothetical protein